MRKALGIIVFYTLIAFTGTAFAQTVVTAGITKETYTNKIHAFSVQYPASYKSQATRTESEIFRVNDPKRGIFVITIEDIPKGAKLENEGKRAFYDSKYGENVKLVSSVQITTQDNTPATLFKLEWDFVFTPVKTLGLSVFRDGKCIGLIYHFPSERQAWGGDIEAGAREIFKSMTFK